MKSHVVIFNRAPLVAASGWIHIVPKGELPNADAKLVQVLDEPALDSILDGIEQAKNRLGDKWPGIYAGREHFIYDDTKDSAALAWFKDFEKRGDGIWAKDDGLTPAGVDAVKNREYKFTSFVADRSDLKKIEGDKYRVMAIETVGFTNQANGKELLTPITNRSLRPATVKQCPDCGCGLTPVKDSAALHCPDCKKDFADAGASAANQQTHNQVKNKMKSIATKLGLAAEASEDAILAEVTKIQNRVTELTPLADENTKLKNRLAVVDDEAVTGLLAAHGVKEEKVLNRLKPVIAALPTLAERTSALVDFGFKKIDTAKPAPRVLNRGTGTGTQQEVTETDAAAEGVRAQKIMNRAAQLMKETKTLSLATATQMAAAEIQS